MVLGIRATSLRRIILIALCCLVVLVLVITTPVKNILVDIVMSAIRTTGPAFRGSCLPRGDIPSSNISIGVLSFNGVKNELYELSKTNREAYCRLHGYPLIDGTDSFLKRQRNRSGGLAYFSWMKIEFVCAMMGKYDHLHWLFWMDTDALFMNIHISLVQLLAGVEKDDLIILAADAEGINAGTFFIRNSPAGRDLCKELLNQRAKYNYEQQAMSALYNKAVEKSGRKCIVGEEDNLNLPSGVKACLDQKAPGFRVLKLCAIGSWAGLERKRGHGLYFDGVYMENDFIIHFAGDRRFKLGAMKQALSGRL